MASYTPNINLKKPTTSEMYNVLDWNDNSDKIDTAIGNLNSQTWKKENATYTSNVDANNYTTPGFYQVGITTNSPYGSNPAYGILVVFSGSSGHCQQLFIAGHNGNMYIRGKNQGTDNFSVWYRVTTTAINT